MSAESEPKPNSTPPYQRFEMENPCVLNDPSSSVQAQKGGSKGALKRSNAVLKWKVATGAVTTVGVLIIAFLLGYYFYKLHNLSFEDEKKELEFTKHGKHLGQLACHQCAEEKEQLSLEGANLRAAEAKRFEAQTERIKSSAAIADYGRIVSKVRFGPDDRHYCVDTTVSGFGSQLYAFPCTEIDAMNYTEPYWIMSVSGRISHNTTCMAYGVFQSHGAPIVATFQCSSDLAATAQRQQWSYDSESLELRHLSAKVCLKLGDKCYEDGRCDLTMAACNALDSRQLWEFAK